MKINKKVFLPTALFIIVLPVSIFILRMEKNKTIEKANENSAVTNAPIVVYYSYSCPHCKKLEQWLSDKKVSDSILYAQKEVSKNNENAKELMEKADFCEIPGNEIGVPFLWDEDGKQCIVGDTDIEKFFEDKLNNKNSIQPAQPSQENTVPSTENTINTK